MFFSPRNRKTATTPAPRAKSSLHEEAVALAHRAADERMSHEDRITELEGHLQGHKTALETTSRIEKGLLGLLGLDGSPNK